MALKCCSSGPLGSAAGTVQRGHCDRKPSELMSEMLTLMDGHRPCLIFKHVFLEQMPDDIYLLLTGEDFAHPLLLAERADELWQAKQQGSGLIERV